MRTGNKINLIMGGAFLAFAMTLHPYNLANASITMGAIGWILLGWRSPKPDSKQNESTRE